MVRVTFAERVIITESQQNSFGFVELLVKILFHSVSEINHKISIH